MRGFFSRFLIWNLVVIYYHVCCFANFKSPNLPSEPSYEKEISEIPPNPSAPPPLPLKVPTDVPHCERYFYYRGKKYECDSNLGNDGEYLRPVLKTVPTALAELNTYQENGRSIQKAAYFGSAGLLAVILGSAIGPIKDPNNGNIRAGGVLLIGGLALVVGSFLYGATVEKTNGVHLQKAVKNYNQFNPDHPVELEVGATFTF